MQSLEWVQPNTETCLLILPSSAQEVSKGPFVFYLERGGFVPKQIIFEINHSHSISFHLILGENEHVLTLALNCSVLSRLAWLKSWMDWMTYVESLKLGVTSARNPTWEKRTRPNFEVFGRLMHTDMAISCRRIEDTSICPFTCQVTINNYCGWLCIRRLSDRSDATMLAN